LVSSSASTCGASSALPVVSPSRINSATPATEKVSLAASAAATQHCSLRLEVLHLQFRGQG
jgi:hypothetical protein